MGRHSDNGTLVVLRNSSYDTWNLIWSSNERTPVAPLLGQQTSRKHMLTFNYMKAS